MSYAVWPSTLPEYVIEQGYQETPVPGTVEHEMETGHTQIRPRFTARVVRIQCQIEMDMEQLDTFETFFESTLARGSLPFEWVHPLKRTPMNFIFKKPHPTYAAFGGEYVRVSMSLESVP
ncbi:MAG: hypothetical protein AB7O57_08100 [Hyphomicrobiaceae bacterium]